MSLSLSFSFDISFLCSHENVICMKTRRSVCGYLVGIKCQETTTLRVGRLVLYNGKKNYLKNIMSYYKCVKKTSDLVYFFFLCFKLNLQFYFIFFLVVFLGQLKNDQSHKQKKSRLSGQELCIKKEKQKQKIFFGQRIILFNKQAKKSKAKTVKGFKTIYIFMLDQEANKTGQNRNYIFFVGYLGFRRFFSFAGFCDTRSKRIFSTKTKKFSFFLVQFVLVLKKPK